MRNVVQTVLIVCLGLAGLCQAQLSPKGLSALEALPTPAVLISPDAFTTASFHGTGKTGQAEVVQGDAEASTWRITVPEKCNNKWDIGMGAPCPKAIAKDDVLLLTFWARNITDKKGGTGEVQAVFRRAEKPYRHCLGQTVKIVGGWHCYAVPFSPSYSLTTDEGRFFLQFGAKIQIMEVRDVSLLNFGKAIPFGVLHRRLGIPLGKGGSKVAGTSLTPLKLWEMGAYDSLPAPDPEFSPTGAWRHTYSIWTCHGYMHQGNKRLGVLEISRTPENESIKLEVRQDIANDEGNSTRCTATILCTDDALASPQSWTLTVMEIGPDGDPRPDLGWQESAYRSDNSFEVQIGQQTVTRRSAARVTADWCLFEAVQRLPFGPAMPPSFDVLEGLTALKTDQQLTYRGEDTVEIGGNPRRLQQFTQIGHGVLPYTYWVDENRRLVMVVTHSRAYILDEKADEAFDHYLDVQRTRYGRLAAKIKATAEGNAGNGN